MRPSVAFLVVLAACSPAQQAAETSPHPVVSVATVEPSGTPLAPEPVVFSKRGELGKVVTVEATKRAPRIDARALVWRARPDETFAMAVRYGPPVKPPPEPRGFGDSKASLQKLEVQLTDPGGETRTLTATLPTPDAVTFWPGRTLFLEIAANGVYVKWPRPAYAPWSEVLATKASGTWYVGVTSHVFVPNSKETFILTSGRVAFDVQSHHPARRDMMAAAEPARVKAGASNKHEPSVEGGFVADTLIQLGDDRWVTRFAKPDIWAFELTSVYLAPEATVLGEETIHVGTCIARSMRIDTPAGPRRVEELAVGDVVWGWSFERGARVATRVMDTVAYPGRPTVWLGGLRLSPTHPVWSDGAWRAAGELDATPGGEATVYRLMVGPPHTFFAEGVLVHNKDRMYSDKLDDPWVFMWDPQAEWWK